MVLSSCGPTAADPQTWKNSPLYTNLLGVLTASSFSMSLLILLGTIGEALSSMLADSEPPLILPNEY